MTQLAISAFALIGTPLLSGVFGYRVFKCYQAGPIERLTVAVIAGLAAFNSWLEVCDKLLRAAA